MRCAVCRNFTKIKEEKRECMRIKEKNILVSSSINNTKLNLQIKIILRLEIIP